MGKKQKKGISFYMTTMVLLFLLVVGSVGLATWAVIKSQLELGGNIFFQSTDKVYATISAGSVEGGTITETNKLNELVFDANTTSPDMSSWQDFNLNFNENGDDVKLNFSITNNNTEKSLLVTTGTVRADSFKNATCDVKVNGNNITTYTIASNVTANYSVIFKVTDKNYNASITNFVIPISLENTTNTTTPETSTYPTVMYQGQERAYKAGEEKSYDIVGSNILSSKASTIAESDSPGPGPTPPPIVVVDEMKFDEFIAEHLEDAKGFINEFVRPEVIEDKDSVSESLFMEPNADNDKVQEVGMIYTYRESANRTIIEYVKVSFDAENLITFNKIVDGEVVKSDIKFAKSIVYQKAINPIIQEENDTFTDQLCDKLFGVNYDATRYIIEGSESLDADLGQVKLFTVIEITDSVIKENTIKLCIA